MSRYVDAGPRKVRINHLVKSLDGLSSDSEYHDLCRTFGEYSLTVLTHLEYCARIQARGENHT